MAILKSSKKNIRKTARQHVFNMRREKAPEVFEKQIKKLVTEGKAKEAMAIMPKFQKAIDKAVKMGTIKKNNASRNKSRLNAQIKKASVK